jgi:hypothetical protein
MTVLIYLDTSKQVGHPDDIRINEGNAFSMVSSKQSQWLIVKCRTRSAWCFSSATRVLFLEQERQFRLHTGENLHQCRTRRGCSDDFKTEQFLARWPQRENACGFSFSFMQRPTVDS